MEKATPVTRLARKHFDWTSNFVLFCRTNIFPCTEISPINKRDEGGISLANLSKCFLANQDNFAAYELTGNFRTIIGESYTIFGGFFE